MKPKYVIIIDTNHLADIGQTDRVRLEEWLRAIGRRPCPNIYTVDCKSSTSALLIVSKLIDRGMPQGSFLVRGGAA